VRSRRLPMHRRIVGTPSARGQGSRARSTKGMPPSRFPPAKDSVAGRLEAPLGGGSVGLRDAGGTVGRLSETGRRLVGQVHALRGTGRSSDAESSVGREGRSDSVPSPSESIDHPYECAVCGRRLLAGEEHGQYCIDGRRTITCSLCDIDLAAAGFVRADGDRHRSPGGLADCA
jgi:hypothetical protein